MTWKELKEKAKKIGYKVVYKIPYLRKQECLVNKMGYGFYRDGTCEIECDICNMFCGRTFAYNRTPTQMYKIMEALNDKD